jgi:hypothetical protein
LEELEKVKIRRIIGPTPNGAAVLLGNDRKTFVVFVGFYEAAALIREINHEVPARPLTHELLQNVFLGFDVEVKQVIISSILESTFCATLILEQRVRNGDGEWVPKRNEVRIDARPSDCFVLALKNKVDIFVTREVFDQVQDVSKMTEEVEGTLAAGGPPGAPGLGELELDFPGPEAEGEGSPLFAGGEELEDAGEEDDEDEGTAEEEEDGGKRKKR